MKDKCPYCNAKIRYYRHVLNRSLIKSLSVLAANNGFARLSKINLGHSQICNFHKLRYWGLVQPGHEDGIWLVTYKGYQFLRNNMRVPSTVVTFRGQVEGYEGPEKNINSYFPAEVWKKMDYINNLLRVPDEGPKLFDGV